MSVTNNNPRNRKLLHIDLSPGALVIKYILDFLPVRNLCAVQRTCLLFKRFWEERWCEDKELQRMVIMYPKCVKCKIEQGQKRDALVIHSRICKGCDYRRCRHKFKQCVECRMSHCVGYCLEQCSTCNKFICTGKTFALLDCPRLEKCYKCKNLTCSKCHIITCQKCKKEINIPCLKCYIFTKKSNHPFCKSCETKRRDLRDGMTDDELLQYLLDKTKNKK